MAWLAERVLYRLVKLFYHTEIAHSRQMKAAESDMALCSAYRRGDVVRVLRAAQAYGVPLEGRTVLDLGCSDGSLTSQYVQYGPAEVIGVDVRAEEVARARQLAAGPGLRYLVSTPDTIPLPDESVDVVVSYDVFEHVTQPAVILRECSRVLRPGGRMLIGTWGWYHPFAHHMWATMPVPWAHVLFSERTVMRTSRRVYLSPWYEPRMYDLDVHGHKIPDKYTADVIPVDYVNKFLIRDFEDAFKSTGLPYKINLEPFGSRYARWTRLFLRFPYLREYFASYFWATLTKPERGQAAAQARRQPAVVLQAN